MKRRTFLQGSIAASMGSFFHGDVTWREAPPMTSRDRPFAITGATVFDTPARRNRVNQTIIIRDERIEVIGDASRIGIPNDADRLDATGTYIVPGLIDAHVHLTHILYEAHMTGDEILPFFLANGVTTVRSTGDNVPAQGLIERYSDDHPDICPRVFRASFLIDGAPPHHPDVGWSLTTPEQVPDFVTHMAGWGVTTLKIYVNCPRAVGQKVIEEGHKHGLVVAGHLTRYHTADAVEDGIDCLEHIYTVADFLRADPEDRHSVDLRSDTTERLVEKIVEHDVFVDPTLMVFWGTLFFVDVPDVIEHPDNAHTPQRLREFWLQDNPRRLASYSSGPLSVRQRTFERYQELVGMLHRAGARILVGTDAPEPQVPAGYSLHHEMEFLVESGLSPAEVLSAATLSNAKVLKQEANLGSIEPGKLADLVVLEANPLEDITNSRMIRHVIKGGRVLNPETILQSAPKT